MTRGLTEAPGNYAWIAPTYLIADRGIEAFRQIAPGHLDVRGRMPARITFTGKQGETTVWFLSAEQPDNIRSFGFVGMAIDEAAMIPRDVWLYVLRPTLADSKGWAVFISTPRGRNWFHDLFTRGQDPLEENYRSFQFPSNANPYFPTSEWEEAKRDMPEDVFRQEYMAEFLEDSAGVFRGVDGVIRPAGVAPVVSGQILIGLDLAKYTDWTVLVAMDAETGACLDMDRFNQLDWTIQKERIIAFCRRWRGRLVMDATGLGDPIYDDLRPALSNIEGFRITGVNKPALIQRLAVAVEQRQISIPADWTVLLNELRRYEYSFTPSGGVQYGAPSGSHDDCVIALALANHRRVGGTGGGLMARLPPPAGTILRPPPAIYVPAEASPRLARPLVRRPAILS